MADMPYPYYKVQADGRNEGGFTLKLQIEEGAGGPLEGRTTEGVLDSLKELLVGGDDTVTVTVTRYEITTTNDL